MDAGTVVADRYRLDRLLKTGGMGQVWSGWDLREESVVAIKLMRSDIAGPDLLERFEREAQLASSLRSRRILPVYGAGRVGDQYFIIMKLLRGRDLAAVMDEGHRVTGLPVGRAVDLAIQLAGGLAAVHEKNVVHRDLKPANLFIEADDAGDQLVICDFGLARDNSSTVSLGYQWKPIGTYAYMAPEQWKGEPVGASADLYATGGILYELLTGRPPFAGAPSEAALMYRHLSQEPVPPRDRNREIPGPLGSLILRLLAKEPGDRPASAVAVGEELRAIREELASPEQRRPAGQATAPLAAGSRTVRHLGAFHLDGTGSLRYDEYSPEPGWVKAGAVPLPAGPVAAVATGSHDDDQLELAVAVGGAIRHQYWVHADGGRWSGWRLLGTIDSPVTDLAFSSKFTGHLEIYAVGADGRIRHRWWGADWFRDSGWSAGWTIMDTPGIRTPVTAIAAGSQANHEQELFVIAGGRVWHRWHWHPEWHPEWTEWGKLPSGRPAVDIACSSLTRTHIETFALDDAGQIWHRWHWPEPGWTPEWAEMPGPAEAAKVTAIASGAHSDRQQDLIALTADGKLYHSSHWLDDGDWTPWTEIPRH